ncbi:MAG TPA: glycine cleavage system aminomethyltransferase GcvT [Geminicoccaceae bacterium]|nr:glycine cleavage system aminomethyltransferase GcvT [Geminicoccaceae bacterium]
MPDPQTTPLDALHRELGARMVDFAGWSMPVQYPTGILKEHVWTRTRASLFDVSHMGQIRMPGADAAAAIESLVPADIQALKPGRARYTQFTTLDGGIIDDLIVTATDDGLYLVVNAGGRDTDLAHLREHLPGREIELLADRALLALQGPAAVNVLARLAPEVAGLRFMSSIELEAAGLELRISRLGYTGEDGFEVSVAAGHAVELARTLLAAEEVQPAGLGARDSLRLEAGLCLYGHDIDRTTSPIEADLAWTVQKRRRAEGGFPGAERILAELRDGPARRLVGIRPEGRAPAREGAAILDGSGQAIGKVTSGGFGPTVDGPVAMGYVAGAAAEPGTPLQLEVRGRKLPARVEALPFVPHRYHR